MNIKGRHIFLIFPSAIEGFLLSLGRILSSGRHFLSFGPLDLAVLLAGFAGAYLLNFLILLYVSGSADRVVGGRFSRIRFLVRTVIIFALWFPVFLAYYPAIWSYDIWAQLPYTSHSLFDGTHPILHTLFIELFMHIGKMFGSYETGMVMLSIIQMILLSLIFSYCVEKTAVRGAGLLARILLTAFYALTPFCSILSVSMTKDVLFTGVFMLMVDAAFDMIWFDPDSLFTRGFMIRFTCICILLALLRSNGIYILAGWAVLGTIFAGKKRRLRFLLLCLLSVIIAFGADKALRRLVHATDIHRKEALSVPIQCMVGTALRHPEHIPPYGTGGMLFDIFPRDLYPENLNDAFKPALADPAKHYWGLYPSDRIDMGNVVRTWLRVGAEYPSDYIDIWGTLTLGAWYPFDTSHAAIYRENEYLLTDFKENAEVGITACESRLPAVKNVLEQVSAYHIQQKFPALNIFFAPAIYVWILVAFFVSFIALLRGSDLFPLFPAALLFATILLGPCVLVRYMFPFMTLAPYCLAAYSGRRN